MEFNHRHYGEVVVLGHVLMIDNTPIDMRDGSWLYKIKNEYRSKWNPDKDDSADFKLGLRAYFEDILDALENEFDWGNNESAKQFALESEDHHIRRMAALNGWFVEELCKDKNALVRAAVVDGLIMRKQLGDRTGALKWVDALGCLEVLAYDDCKLVRERVAAYGVPEYLIDLVSDCEASVREVVAQTTDLFTHLEVLAKDADTGVRMAVAKNRHFCEFELLQDDENEAIRKVVKQRQSRYYSELAYSVDANHADKLLQCEDEGVREILANRGIGLETLVNDIEPRVRLAVAMQGYGLDQLVNDPSVLVRSAAVAYPAILSLPDYSE